MELRCPHCNTVFQVDESGYSQIAQQVRDEEFKKELERRTKELEEKQKSQMEVAKIQQQQAHNTELSQKDTLLSEKEMQIQELKAKLDSEETKKQLAISEAIKQKDAVIQKLNSELENKTVEQKLALTEAISQKDSVIQHLNTELESKDAAQKLAISEALQEKEKELSKKDSEIIKLQGQLQNEIVSLQGQLKNKENETQLREKALQEKYDEQLKMKDEQIAYYKDFKAKQSTKMIGESLEQHCQNSFNNIRMTAFPNAYFEKDNDARYGSKGDFIFKESKDGIEFLSIMFECKNEADETVTKHKNEDFFKELDKDRREKNCEYAVLVSMLEIDNDFYNNGIVDVSYKYPKMYVIRPQFFIPIITLLRNAALNSLQYQQELAIVRSQQLDLNNFEENMQTFKTAFTRNYRIASEKFATAIEEIDKTISHLQKTKDALLSSQNNLRLANNKAEDLSIKKLTKNAPSLQAMFEENEKKKKHDLDDTDLD